MEIKSLRLANNKNFIETLKPIMKYLLENLEISSDNNEMEMNAKIQSFLELWN